MSPEFGNTSPGHAELELLAAQVIQRCSVRRERIAVAESLTGGLLAAILVGVPGASRVLNGGIVAYDTSLKHQLLGVDAAVLHEHGPVNEVVAKQMASHVRERCAISSHSETERRSADIGISTTGVAGPDPDPQSGAVSGTVWIAVSYRGQERSRLLPDLQGRSREEIRYQTVAAALHMVLNLTDES